MVKYKWIFRILLVFWVCLMLVGSVKHQTEPKAILKICKKKIQTLMDEVIDNKVRRKKYKYVMLTDLPSNDKTRKIMKKYFRVKNISDEEKEQEFLKSDIFYFINRRYPVSHRLPCSLFFQNSLNGYLKLHRKSDVDNIIKSIKRKSPEFESSEEKEFLEGSEIEKQDKKLLDGTTKQKNELKSIQIGESNLRYLPSFNLSKKQECLDFFELKNQEDNFIVKTDGSVMNPSSEFVTLLDKSLFETLKEKYMDGKLCEKNTQPDLKDPSLDERTIIQRLIRKPVIYKGHKLDFRQYVLIEKGSGTPIIHFFDGFGRVAIQPFGQLTANPHYSQLSNLRIAKEFAQKHSIKEVQGEKLDDFLVKNFEEISQILKEQDINFNKHLESLQHGFKSIFEHSKLGKINQNSLYQLFAVDFAISKTDKVYLLEINAFPNLAWGNSKKDLVYTEFLHKMFKILKNKVKKTKKALKKMVLSGTFSEKKVIEDYN